MPEVSIIIPVYNAEKYLQRCLDSVINQTFVNLEIIIINDQSTDNSLKICNDYKEKDSRIIVIDKKNEGVSKARNTGLQYARGKYISFIDADDYIDSNMMESLYNKIKSTDADICICNFINELNGQTKFMNIQIHDELNNNTSIRNDLIPALIERKDGEKEHTLAGFRSPWGRIFNKKIIDEYNIRFQEDLAIGEDFIFNLEFLIHSNKVAFCEGYYYHYINNNTSALMKYSDNCWQGKYRKIIIYLKKFLDDNNLWHYSKSRVFKLIVKYLFICLYNERKVKKIKSSKEIIKIIKMMGNDQLIKKAINEISIRDYNLKEKIIIILLKFKLYIPVLIINNI